MWLATLFWGICFQTGSPFFWVYSRDFGVIAGQPKGSALRCTISQCLSALSQNNWCQAYMVYMPIPGAQLPVQWVGAGQEREGSFRASSIKCSQINVCAYSYLTSKTMWRPRLWPGHWAELGDPSDPSYMSVRAERKCWTAADSD